MTRPLTAHVVLTLVIILCLVSYASGAGTITGKVVDSNQKPLGGCTVSLLSGGLSFKTTTTNDQGAYNFDYISSGEYSIKIEHSGYDPIVEKIGKITVYRVIIISSVLFPVQVQNLPGESAQQSAVAKPWWDKERFWELMTFLGFLLAAAGTAGTIDIFIVRKRSWQLKREIERFRDYARRTRVIDSIYLDVIILGPRNAGKTALCELWETPWADITQTKPTESWQTHDIAVCEGTHFSTTDPLFEVERTHVPQYRLKVWDYAGEDHLRPQAIGKLTDLSKAALVLVFPCSVGKEVGAPITAAVLETAVNRNLEYFNIHFLDRLAHLPQISKSIQRVFVVFNKIDILPTSWSSPEYVGKLLQTHQTALEKIEHLFKDIIEYEYVSAFNNTHAISLLGKMTKLLLKDVSIPKEQAAQVQESLLRATQKFERKQ